jgi:hypothetical protein
MENVVWTSKQSSNEFLTLHVQQSQNPSSKIKKGAKETNQKRKEKTKRTKEKHWLSNW